MVITEKRRHNIGGVLLVILSGKGRLREFHRPNPFVAGAAPSIPLQIQRDTQEKARRHLGLWRNTFGIQISSGYWTNRRNGRINLKPKTAIGAGVHFQVVNPENFVLPVAITHLVRLCLRRPQSLPGPWRMGSLKRQPLFSG